MTLSDGNILLIAPFILQGAREYKNAINWLKTEFKGSLTSIFSASLALFAVLFLISRRARGARKGIGNGFQPKTIT